MSIEQQLAQQINSLRQHAAEVAADRADAVARLTADTKGDAFAEIDALDADLAATTRRIALLEERVALAQQTQTDEARAAAIEAAKQARDHVLAAAASWEKDGAALQKAVDAFVQKLVAQCDRGRAILAAARDAGVSTSDFQTLQRLVSTEAIDYAIRACLARAGLTDALGNYLCSTPVSNVGDVDVAGVTQRAAANMTARLKSIFGGQ